MQPKFNVVNAETGEIISVIKSGDKILRKKSRDVFANTVVINEPFIKLFINNITIILEVLKDTKGKIKYDVVVLLFYLFDFISYKSGLLQHANGKPLTNQYIINNFNMSQAAIYNALKDLKDKGIISIVDIHKDKYYMMNPWIASKGTRIDKTHIHIFKDTVFANYEIKPEE